MNNCFLSIISNRKAKYFLIHSFMLLLMLLSAERASAYDFMWDESRYMAIGMGTSVSFELPIYDKDGRDMWVIDGYVTVKAAGKSEVTVLHYKSEGDISGSAKNNDAKFDTSIGGVVKIKDKSGSWVRLSNTQQMVQIYSTGDNFTAQLEWEPPYEWRGMDLEFTIKVHGDQYAWKEWNRTFTKKVSALMAPPSKIEPSIMTSMLATESGHMKETNVMWQIAANKVTSATAYYKVNGVRKSAKLPNETFGSIYVPSDQLVDSLYVKVDYKDNEDKDVSGVVSNYYDVPYFHMARNVRTKLLTNGHVELTWEVDNPDRSDIISTDFWLIQRNVSGSSKDDDANWMTIGQESYRQGNTKYTFPDETINSVYQNKTVYYRIQRASVSDSWGYGTQSGAGKSVLLQKLALPGVLSASASKADNWGVNDKHPIQLSWITDASPMDADGSTMFLRDTTDWKNLCLMVSRGFTTVNVVMLGDVDISKSTLMLGEEGNPYQGTFDGRGCTLTVNFNNTEVYCAPFQYAGGATIKNLRVAGNVKGGLHSAGMIGSAQGANTIEGCRVSAAVTFSGRGTASPHGGGFVGHGGDHSTTIRNSLFDGKLIATSAADSYAGAFIGWEHDTKSVLENNLENGTYQNVAHAGFCYRYVNNANSAYGNNSNSKNNYSFHNWGEMGSGYNNVQNLTAHNLASKLGNGWTVNDNVCVPLGAENTIRIKTLDDWNRFASLVNGGATGMNAVLDADITVSSPSPTIRSYSGIFDGRGHTITINISGASALFGKISNATIKNLYVTGSLSASNYRMCGGIVGEVQGTSPCYLYNCRSSVEIFSTRSGDTCNGGLIGSIEKDAKTLIKDCLFDGSLIGLNSNDNGGFVGWVSDYGNVSLVNCLMRANLLTTSLVGCQTFVRYNDSRTTGVVENCYYTKTYGSAQGIDASQMAPVELRNALGSGWKISDDKKVVPLVVTDPEVIYVWDSNAQMKLITDKYVKGELRYTDERLITESERKAGKIDMELASPCVDYGFRIVVDRTNSQLCIGKLAADVTTDTCSIPMAEALFYFDNNVKLDSLKAVNQHSSVQLQWYTSGGSADYFQVYRRDLASKEAAVLLDGEVQAHSYTDNTALAHHEYEYTVTGVTQCEGIHESSLTCTGRCDNFGRVSGFVRMSNGTGIGGIQVKAIPCDELEGVGIERIVITDDTGYYMIDSLFYVPNYGSYTIQVQVPGGGPLYTDATCTFSESKNEFTNIVLALREYYVFTGKVLYEGTSIPVPGAQFRMDGKPIYNYQQKRVETDNQGAFSISVPAGPHKIQVEKEGHVFESNGYYIDRDNKKDTTEHNWQRNIADVYLWDQTRVTLRGRIIGGNVQGQKPLGRSLSRNNLGHDLKMVMQLEGDNTSWIVRDPLDLSIKERRDSLRHGAIDPKTQQPREMTHWEMTRHSITVHPNDSTGEYEIKLFPVKYKITEMSCTGYSTLFQQGKVGETLDLTGVPFDSIAEFKWVYHSPVKLDVKQVNFSDQNFFGDNFYLAHDIDNRVDTVFIWSPKTKTTPEHYALGYPVFMANASYLFSLQAQEEYPFENRKDTVADIVPLHQGTVYFHNDLVGNQVTDSVKLDSLGRGTYQFIPKNTTFLGNDESSMRTLDINLLYDGVYYDVKPFNGGVMRAYVMGAVPQANGRQTVSKGGTHLIDILRDPPGAGSSAYIESGSKVKYAYTLSMDGKIGMNMERVAGTGSNFYKGLWAGTTPGGSVGGTITNAKSSSQVAVSFGVKCGGTWVYSYEMTTTQRIQTSSSPKWIGPKADIYIGMTDNIIVGEAVAVRMVPASQFDKLKLRTNGKIQLDGHKYDIKNGTVQVLATGADAKGNKVYLISDEVYNYYAQFNSEFIHTGAYIETELIPNLLKMRNERLLPKGTDKKAAQAMADRDGRSVYISKVDASHPEFGYHASLASDTVAKYEVIRPSKLTSAIDEIEQYNKEIITWAGFIAKNEKEKVQAPYAADLVKHIDFDGAANVQYSESFSTADDYSRYLRYEPFSLSVNTIPDQLVSNTLQAAQANGVMDENGGWYVDVQQGSGSIIQIKIKPVFTVDINDKDSKSESWSKKAGFTLSSGNKSNLSISVYRSKVNKNEVEDLVNKGEADKFLLYGKKTLDHVRGGATGLGAGLNWMTYASSDEQMYGNFIFLTNGGATVSPWEDERKTKLFQPGTVYDQKTIRIDQLRIWTNQSIVSNVPSGEPARFTVYMCNESPTPDKASPYFTLAAPDDMNQYGAKIMYGGNALNGTGYILPLTPGVVVAKEIEVYAGADFDYEDLGLQLYDANDLSQTATLKLSAHFVPSAGNISISTPGDKWVVNTESPYDERERKYYMPVRIDGFNVNQRNFDHIELQYKLSTQGDKDWVNICSYYKSDSLMALANGTCQLIENDGYITARFFGEKDPVEQYYDLRAVVYCRNSNGFLTASSPILTGVKDTRRPQPFGTPKPVNGILGIGDDITIAFSEPIAANYLSEVNNFEVLGLANSNNITEGTCLHFNGDTGAVTSTVRNISGKSFTLDVMINPDTHTIPMGIFFHGNIHSNIQCGLTGDNRLMAMINHEVFVSDKPVEFSGLHQVSYVFNVDTEKLQTKILFYDGNIKIGEGIYEGIYECVGFVVLGSSFLFDEDDEPFESESYRGSMLEFRIWNKALSESEIKQHAKKHLTGYEAGLLDNFPMNEGQGKVSYNKAVGGTDLLLTAATWRVPAGLSAKLDGEKGVVLNDSAFVRTNSQDYTLMFWFRTQNSDGTLLANGPAQDEPQWKNHFNICMKEGHIYYRNGKFEVTNEKKSYNDGVWHHLAVTLNRSRNVGNLYVDQQLLNTFAVDTLGGILGGTLAAGATYKDAYTPSDAIEGNIDEIAFYEMTMPVNVIKDYASVTPSGREMGTLVYLPFSRSEMQKSHEQRLVASGQSIKQSRDNQGNYSTRMDVIIPDDVVEQVSDRENYAPIDNSGKRENLNYSFVADKQNLLINIDEPAANIEKTNVYVTVRDVADLNGNLMETPVMMDLYVYRNPLRWGGKHLNIETYYGEGATISVTIQNPSGKPHSYYIENQPLWITPSKISGTIAATDEEIITLNISPFTNIGDFDEIINLVSEEGMNEPLLIHLKVRGDKPEWAVSESLKKKNITMTVIGRVMLDGVLTDDPDDIIGVFGNGHEPLGVAHLNVDNTANANEALAFITVYGTNKQQQPLRFEYFDATTGRISVLKRQDGQPLVFYADSILGSTTNPIILVNSGEDVQTLRLKEGWNWVSFYVKPEKNTVSNLLNRATHWEVGDALEVLGTNGYYEISYKGIPDSHNPTRINYFWDNGNDSIVINEKLMYRFYSCSDKMAYLNGYHSGTQIIVHPGWNRIAYISRLNLPISTALAAYTTQASVGDIIKSQSEFAMLVEDNQNNRIWKGTLTHLTAGEGYMLKHLGSDDVKFNYPYYEGVTRYGNANRVAPLFVNNRATSMNVVARTKGVNLQQGDRLLVFNGTELCGKTELTSDSLFFLSVADSKDEHLSFAIERDNELIAVSGEQMTYKPDAVIGTVSQPTEIRFASVGRFADGEWYDIQGRKLAKRPQRKGVYIYNGQKTIVE